MKYFLIASLITLFVSSTAYAGYHSCMDNGGYHDDCKGSIEK